MSLYGATRPLCKDTATGQHPQTWPAGHHGSFICLTHWGRVTHICVSDLTSIFFFSVAWSAPSHYQNQCWNIVNKILRNKLKWNFNRNSNIFIQENGFESVVCEMAAILYRPQCVKPSNVVVYSPCLRVRNSKSGSHAALVLPKSRLSTNHAHDALVSYKPALHDVKPSRTLTTYMLFWGRFPNITAWSGIWPGSVSTQTSSTSDVLSWMRTWNQM